MSVALIPDEGMKLYLDKMNSVGALSFQLKLFQNNFTPSKSSVFANFTEATFSGYTAQTVTFSGSTVTANVASIAAAAITFTRSIGATSNTIYGWYLTDSISSKVFACNLLATPKAMTTNGDGISVTLTELLGDLP